MGYVKAQIISAGLATVAHARPPGKAHRYFFRLFVLHTALHLNAGAHGRNCNRR